MGGQATGGNRPKDLGIVSSGNRAPDVACRPGGKVRRCTEDGCGVVQALGVATRSQVGTVQSDNGTILLLRVMRRESQLLKCGGR